MSALDLTPLERLARHTPTAEEECSSGGGELDVSIARFESGDFSGALNLLRPMLLRWPKNAQVRFWCGRCSFQTHDYESAVDDFQRCLELYDAYGGKPPSANDDLRQNMFNGFEETEALLHEVDAMLEDFSQKSESSAYRRSPRQRRYSPTSSRNGSVSPRMRRAATPERTLPRQQWLQRSDIVHYLEMSKRALSYRKSKHVRRAPTTADRSPGKSTAVSQFPARGSYFSPTPLNRSLLLPVWVLVLLALLAVGIGILIGSALEKTCPEVVCPPCDPVVRTHVVTRWLPATDAVDPWALLRQLPFW